MKILSLFLMISIRVFACESVNLYQENILDLDISNQGDMHTCYAHSLSTLYSYENNIQVNPYWLAFIHKDRLLHWSPRNLNFSLLSWAFADLKKKGLCSSEKLSSRLNKLKSGINYSDDQYFYFLQAYFLKEQNHHNLLSFLIKESKDFEVEWKQADINKLVKDIQASGEKKLFDYLRNEVFVDCFNLESVHGELASFARGFESNSSLKEEVNRVLEDRKILSIGLCPDGAYKKIDDDYQVKIKPRIFKATKSKCGAHYVNIVGKRKNKNRCEYLIRNSYPGFWAHKSFDCFCLNKQGEKVLCKKGDKDIQAVLGCWIPSEKILSNTYDISYLK
jgi:hypothetical protein